jgi:hypothetical protein
MTFLKLTPRSTTMSAPVLVEASVVAASTISS